MITEFEEHYSRGSSRVQFTISKSSLPNLLEWTERLQARFQVTIDIQWELEEEASVREAGNYRWVVLDGHAEDCKKAKNYITVFCDAPHKMSVNYPESIHTELKESQIKLEEDYSSVLQFLKVGQLLIKSNDEINLSLILSVIEEAASCCVARHLVRTKQSFASSELSMRGRHLEEPPLSYTPDDDDLDVDSREDVPVSEMRSQVTPPPEMSSKRHSPTDLLGGEPLVLRGKADAIFPGQLTALFSPESSQDSISPDRKKIKSHPDRGHKSRSSVRDSSLLDASYTNLFAFSLSSQQRLAIQRVLQRGGYTQSEIDRFLQKAGSDWKCSDLITMLHAERTRRNVPETMSHKEMLPSIKLEKLKNTQELLIQSLIKQDSPDPIEKGSSSEFWPTRFSTPMAQAGKPQALQPAKKSKDASFIKEELFPHGNRNGDHFHQDVIETQDHSTVDATDSIIIIDDNDSIIIIPSESESEVIIDDSSGESDTQEEFYVKGVLQERPKKTGVALQQRGSKLKHFSRSKLQPPAERQQTDELHGVVESLKQQLQDMQDKIEWQKAEASSEQQVVTLMQQTQQEEMQRQYKQQQQNLLQQQRQFEKQFKMQEEKLKAQQEIALKQLHQQQQEQAISQPDARSEAIVIAPARKTPASPLRPVVVDGSNVAMRHGRHEVFSCCGIALCIQYFQKRGHQDITVFVPLDRGTQNPNKPNRTIRDQKILGQLEKQGLLSYTPSRRIGNNYINCYDDRFIVELAAQNDGVIVSNDNYRDLIGVSPRWKYVIENRLVMFTFAGDHFMIPDDPMGKSGPSIKQLLRKSTPRVSAANVGGYYSGLTVPGQTTPAPTGSMGLIPKSSLLLGPIPTSSPTGTQLGWHPRQASAPTLQSRTAAAGAPAWGIGAATGTQVVRHGTTTAQQKPQHVPSSTSTALTKPMSLAPTFGKKAIGKDPTQHPCYETLMTIFPTDEDAVLQVLTKYSGKDDANELVIQVLLEKEKSSNIVITSQ